MRVNALKSIGVQLQKINLLKLIDDLERDQIFADAEVMEDEERKAICREAVAACMETMLEHLSNFREERPDATYEEWIMKLHPDNADDKRRNNVGLIDHRFYVEESDHRIIWNETMDSLATNVTNQDSILSRKVQSRYKHGAP
mmetsp:Transcript_27945/g.33085  ORF Transcript_27945/g.33085 Transcript_27945/m.33085 type:complete len:143 (+) Transcript_27945:139-567(+)